MKKMDLGFSRRSKVEPIPIEGLLEKGQRFVSLYKGGVIRPGDEVVINYVAPKKINFDTKSGSYSMLHDDFLKQFKRA